MTDQTNAFRPLDVSEYDCIAAFLAASAHITGAEWPNRQAEQQALAALDVFLASLGFQLEDGAARDPSGRMWDLSADKPEVLGISIPLDVEPGADR